MWAGGHGQWARGRDCGRASRPGHSQLQLGLPNWLGQSGPGAKSGERERELTRPFFFTIIVEKSNQKLSIALAQEIETGSISGFRPWSDALEHGQQVPTDRRGQRLEDHF